MSPPLPKWKISLDAMGHASSIIEAETDQATVTQEAAPS